MKSRPLDVRDLGRRAYRPVLELQRTLVEQRQSGETGDVLLLVEHDPVYTLGRNASQENVLVSDAELQRRGIDLVRVGRGGQVTYHGPGQLVGYPVLHLGAGNRGPVWYVSCLEKVLIACLAEYGVSASTDPQNRGVWVGDEKVAAIGVRITRHVTMHGFALNVTTDLGPYGGIVPCGITDKGVTSLARLVGDVEMSDVKARVVRNFCEILDYEATGR